jgi:predicted nucleic acid-binding protein
VSESTRDLAVIVVDTDVTSLMWRAALPADIERHFVGRRLVVTFITKGEALEGAYRKFDVVRQEGLRAFYEHTFGMLEWDEQIPETYARLRAAAAVKGYNVAQNDCWIAACCVSHGLPLMTRNRRHFEPLRPVGLRLL